jgi:two-component system, OmpR family, sensor histidine kinase BaeS
VDDRLGLLTHELRSPVAALVAIAETVAERGGELDGRTLRRLLQLAAAAGRDVERIVLDAAPASLRPELVDPGRLVADAVTTARLGGAVIRIRAEVEPGLPTLQADPVRLRQALGNLIGNALAHSPAGREIVVSARSAEAGVELAVADEGAGIAPAEQQAIFEPGVRYADRPGEGIGLAVARAVAEAHGGRIAVESSVGAGATFRLVLPLAAGRG